QGLRAFLPAPSYLNRAIFLFILVCMFSALGSILLTQSVHGFFTKTLEWFIIYFLVLEVFTERRHIIIALSIFLFSASATILDSFIQFYFTRKDIFNGFIMGGKGATAAFRHPNQLAAFLIFISTISFSFLFRQKASSRFRLFFFIFFILTLWSLLLTFSRAG